MIRWVGFGRVVPDVDVVRWREMDVSGWVVLIGFFFGFFFLWIGLDWIGLDWIGLD